MAAGTPLTIGEKHALLTVVADLGYIPTGNQRARLVLAECECGAAIKVRLNNLRSGRTKSCGAEQHVARFRKHGMIGTPEYEIWRAMRRRCLNPTDASYKNYGGRGITICERWSDFAAFYEDMGPRPADDLELDRRDNNKGYSPDNCRWTSRQEQSRNTRENHWIEFNGRRMLVTDWAIELGITTSGLVNRLKVMPVEQAITLPVRPRNQTLTFNGQTKLISAWARDLGFTYEALLGRLKKVSVEVALTTPHRRIASRK